MAAQIGADSWGLGRWCKLSHITWLATEGAHLGAVQQLSTAPGPRLPLCDQGAQHLHERGV